MEGPELIMISFEAHNADKAGRHQKNVRIL
jgi:hypothetical protein